MVPGGQPKGAALGYQLALRILLSGVLMCDACDPIELIGRTPTLAHGHLGAKWGGRTWQLRCLKRAPPGAEPRGFDCEGSPASPGHQTPMTLKTVQDVHLMLGHLIWG